MLHFVPHYLCLWYHFRGHSWYGAASPHRTKGGLSLRFRYGPLSHYLGLIPRLLAYLEQGHRAPPLILAAKILWCWEHLRSQNRFPEVVYRYSSSSSWSGMVYHWSKGKATVQGHSWETWGYILHFSMSFRCTYTWLRSHHLLKISHPAFHRFKGTEGFGPQI